MIKVKDGYAKLINTSYTGDISLVLLSNGSTIGYDVSTNTVLATIGSNVASADKLKNKVKLWGLDFDGTSDVNGSIVMTNDSSIAIKTSSGTDISLLHFPASHNFHLGYGAATYGFNTYIDGNNIYFRYGTSHTTGITLDSSGVVSFANHIKLGNNKNIYFNNTSGTAINVLNFSTANNLHIGSGVATTGYSTYIDGATVRMRYGTSTAVGFVLNSSGNITIGSSDLASTNYKLYVGGNVYAADKIISASGFIISSGKTYSRVHIFANDSASFIQASNADGSTQFGDLYLSGSNLNNLNSLHLQATTTYISGNVGIGTSNPSAKLHVAGSIYSTGEIHLTSGTAYPRLRLVYNSSGSYIQASSNDGTTNAGGNLICSGNGSTALSKFEVYATTSKFNGNVLATGGFIKSGSDDTYVLLGGGGHKLLSDFVLASEYVLKTGDTMTGVLTFNHNSGTNANIIFKNNRLSNSQTSNSADNVILINDATNTTVGRFGMYGITGVLSYLHIGLNGYNGNNLRIYSDKVTFGDSTIWHSGNDGSGSGLDADLLDGQHGSYYAAASSLSNYLPLSGGTMTGKINFSANSSDTIWIGATAETSGTKSFLDFFISDDATDAFRWRTTLYKEEGNVSFTMMQLSGSNSGVATLALTGNMNATGTVTANKFVSGNGVNDFSAGTVKLDVLNIPTSSGGTTFGPGSNGQVLKSNGTTVYWASDSNSNTWRPVSVNGTSVATSTTGTGTLNIVLGTGITVSGAVNSLTITNAGVRSVTIGTGDNANRVAVNTNGTTAYLVIPYATTASLLNNTYVSDPATAASGQYLKWYSQINRSGSDPYYAGTNAGFPVGNNANGILWLGTHSGPYGGLLGVSSDGRLYYRFITNNAFPTTANGGSWNKIAWTSNIPTKTSLLTNDSGFLTSRGYIGTTAVLASSAAQALTGITTATLSSTLSVGGKISLTGTTADTCHILFTRTNYNYITFPDGYSLAFGIATGSASTMFRMDKSAFFPERNSEKTLGTSSKRWSNVYSVAGNFAGTVTIACAWPNIVCNNNASGATESDIRFEVGGVNKGYIGYKSGIGTYLYNSSAAKYVYIGDNGYFYTQSYINAGAGNEKNASNPPYVWGVNGSDNFMRTYATSSLSVGTANKASSADWLNPNTTLTYGASGLNYFNINGTAGNTKANNTPTSAWYHVLRMNHANSGGYLADIAVPLNDVSGIWWRQIRNGSFYGWYRVVDSNNYAGILDGRYRNAKISRAGGSYSWYNIQQYNSSDANPSYYSADCAIINITSYAGWLPWIRAVDSEKGSWAIGLYTTNFHIGYIPKTNTSNSLTKNWTFYKDGALGCAGTVTATHFYESSDINLKTNIEAINTSDNIPLLKAFDWKDSGEHSYGLIAQELEEQGYSELVSTKDDGYKTVNYSAALSLIVGKLQVKIRELEKEIEILKNKN